MKKLTLTILLSTSMIVLSQTNFKNINQKIEAGEFSEAIIIMNDLINGNQVSQEQKEQLKFEVERLNRIKKDFKLTSEDVLKYVNKYIPDANEDMLKEWEDDGSLEFKIIEGKKLYFNRSHTNLFRLNKQALKEKEKTTGKTIDELDALLEKLVPKLIAEIDNNESIYSNPNKIKLTYTLTVPVDKVPTGEIIKCWLPYPREGHKRQTIVSFSSPDKYTIADNSKLQRSVYFEKTGEANEPTIFQYELILSNKAVNFNIDPEKVEPYKNSDEYVEFTAERPPHIVFTEKIKKLSDEIVGDEKNPYLIAKKIFTWIHNNIPWAGAREYSTILNISDYCITNMHGDCGIKTLLFMTLARYNGIPTKWQSGWMLHPGRKNLHDWCEAYFEGYGWVPVDQSFGITISNDPRVQYFYLGGIDQYRFIANDDFSREFSPKKEHFRSETVDFQRGEVEWSGGNLYFDDWDYSMKIEYLE